MTTTLYDALFGGDPVPPTTETALYTTEGEVFYAEANDLYRVYSSLIGGEGPMPCGYRHKPQSPELGRDCTGFEFVVELCHTLPNGELHDSWGVTDQARYNFWVATDRRNSMGYIVPVQARYRHSRMDSTTRHGKTTVRYTLPEAWRLW